MREKFLDYWSFVYNHGVSPTNFLVFILCAIYGWVEVVAAVQPTEMGRGSSSRRRMNFVMEGVGVEVAH